MSYSPNYNLPYLPTGAVDWVAVINDIVAKVEAGRTMKVTAGENIAQYNAVAIPTVAAGKVFKADYTMKFFGIAKDAIALDAEGYIYTGVGNEVTIGAHGFAVGNPVYVSAVAGSLTENAPRADAVPVAFANTATSIVILRIDTYPAASALDIVCNNNQVVCVDNEVVFG